MKTIKRYLSILLVLSMMLCSTSMFTVKAAQVTETEKIVVVADVNLGGEDELQPMVAGSCDNYYLQGEPTIPTGAVLIGEPTIGNYVSNSFLDHVSGLGYSTDGWYYYMENYRMPNGQIVKYHIWANDYHDVTFYHV